MKKHASRGRQPVVIVAAAGAALWIAACGSSGVTGAGGHATTSTKSGVCTPGATQVCVGPGACQGGQQCQADGLAWGACNCGTSSSSSGTGGGASSSGTGGGASSSSSASSTSSSGNCTGMACATPSNCPAPPSDCVAVACSAGCCGTTDRPAGVACATAGGNVCNGTGSCVGCLQPGDCSAQPSLCRVNTCASATCGVTNAPAQTPCADSGGKICNTAGTCVQCLATGDCPGTSICCAEACVLTMFDAKNCGACGHDCLGSACQSGMCAPSTLASALTFPGPIAVDATSVYWNQGAIMKMPIAGGAPTQLAATAGGLGIAVDATSVYWTTDLSSGAVMKVALGGGSPVTLASGLSFPSAITVDASNAYWTQAGTVMKVPLGGGSPVTLASGQTSPTGIVVAGGFVYWTTSGVNNTIMKVGIGGGSPVTLASAQTSPTSIAVDATSVYWTNNASSGEVMKVAVGGGTPVQLASNQAWPFGIVVDATSVYWTNQNPGAVMKVAIAGGAPVQLAAGQPFPEYIAEDAVALYWTNSQNPGSVVKVAK